MKNVFVVGLEPFNLALLQGIGRANEYSFHQLLSYHEAVRPRSGQIDFDSLLNIAQQRLAAFSGSIDTIIGYWDFPASVIVPILRHRLGLPGPPLEAVAICEHKYWYRMEQRLTTPDLAPRFCAVDPFSDDPLSQIDLSFPFWIKPVKAHSSYLGFRIRNEAEFNAALPVIRDKIGLFGAPFDTFLKMIEVPAEIAGIGGYHCIAEEIISSGRQCTLEGYVHNGEVVVYGVIDSIRAGKHRSCFSRYQYPSRIPRRVQDRMIAGVARFLCHIGYNQAPFNAEFFWHPPSDSIRALEINTRISKSHCPLFLMVDGTSHQKVAVDIAFGRKPDFPHRQGRHRIAAKFMFRVFEDGIVERLPTVADIDRMKQRFPDALVRVLATEGQKLSHLPYQDSYSYELAEIFLGAESQPGLLEKYNRVLDMLPFQIAPQGEAAA